MVEIEADFRERGASLAEALARRTDVRLSFRALKAGDYAFGRIVGIERKTADDFARSIVDGRLFRQATRLAKFFPRPMIIVEGDPSGHLSPEAVRGAFVSLAAIFRVPVLRSAGAEESADLVLTAARQALKSFEDGYARPGYRPKGLRARQLYVLKGLPGVGPRRANALLDRFGSIEAVVTADARVLGEVRGIGRGVARAIRETVLSAPPSPPSPPAPSRPRPSRTPETGSAHPATA